MAITAGTYLIRSALDEDFVLLTSGGSKSKAAKIATGTLTETDNRCYWNISVVSSSYNRMYNINTGSTNGNLMAASITNNKAITQNAYKLATGAWRVVASGNTMIVNGANVNTYYIKPRSNSNLYVTVPDNGGNLYLHTLSPDTPSSATITTVGEVTNVAVDIETFKTAVNNIGGIYSFVYDGENWLLDENVISLVTYGITYDDVIGAGVSIDVSFTPYTEADTTNQEFYFQASTYVDKSLATPKTLRTQDDKTYVVASGSTTFYPQWKSSNTSKIYELRHRSRCYDTDGNLDPNYGVDSTSYWSAWTGWRKISATAQLDSKKKYSGVMRSASTITTPSVDNSTYIKAEIQVQARLTSAKTSSAYNTTNTKHGTAVSQTITQYCNPTLNFTAALYSPDGLAIAYTTDYKIAGSTITIQSIIDNGVTLLKDYTILMNTDSDYAEDLYLSCDELYSLPRVGDTLKIKATITAENGIAKRTVTKNVTVTYDSSWGLTVEPEYTLTDKLSVLAKIESYPTLQFYYEHKQIDGTSLWVACDEISRETEGNIEYITYEFAPAYGAPPNLMWLVIDENANWTNAIIAPEEIAIDSKYYSWFWFDENNVSHAAILKYRVNEIMQPSDDITLPAYKFVTTGREYPVFRYSKSLERKLDIEGAILNDESDIHCLREDFELLATANHCVYRQPDGKWYQVAIKGIKFVRKEGYVEVHVEQEAETR